MIQVVSPQKMRVLVEHCMCPDSILCEEVVQDVYEFADERRQISFLQAMVLKEFQKKQR